MKWMMVCKRNESLKQIDTLEEDKEEIQECVWKAEKKAEKCQTEMDKMNSELLQLNKHVIMLNTRSNKLDCIISVQKQISTKQELDLKKTIQLTRASL